jgi:hypothetical protein
MFKPIEGLAADVLAIEANGQISHQDYRATLIPLAKRLMAQGPISTIYVIGPEFTGSDLEALWDDSAFGFTQWHAFRQIAVVTDRAWMVGVINMFKPFFHGEARLFRLTKLSAAKDWIVAALRDA